MLQYIDRVEQLVQDLKDGIISVEEFLRIEL